MLLSVCFIIYSHIYNFIAVGRFIVDVKSKLLPNAHAYRVAVMFVSAASDITLCYEIMDNGIVCVLWHACLHPTFVSTKLYSLVALMTGHISCTQFVWCHYTAAVDRGSNPWSLDCMSVSLPLWHQPTTPASYWQFFKSMIYHCVPGILLLFNDMY